MGSSEMGETQQMLNKETKKKLRISDPEKAHLLKDEKKTEKKKEHVSSQYPCLLVSVS